jgi:hypothetical protein
MRERVRPAPVLQVVAQNWEAAHAWRWEIAVVLVALLCVMQGAVVYACGVVVAYVVRALHSEVAYGLTPTSGPPTKRAPLLGGLQIETPEDAEDTDDDIFTHSGRPRLFGREKKVVACRECCHSRCICGAPSE